MIKFTDTHTHLYHESFASIIDELIENAAQKGIRRFVLPNIDEASIDAMLMLKKKFAEKTFLLMGLHPCSVDASYMKILDHMYTYLSRPEICGIGEIGLDFYWDKTYVYEQEEALKIQLQWAIEKNWPVSLHCRNSIDRTIILLKEVLQKFSAPSTFTGVFHCFTGSLEQAKRITELGFYLGIGGVLTFKNAGLAEVLQHVDLKHLVLETDAPYLAPVPHRGKPNLPEYLYFVAEKLAEIKKCSLETISEITEKNANHIFGFTQ